MKKIVLLLTAGFLALGSTARTKGGLDPERMLSASAAQYHTLIEKLGGADRFPQTYDYNMDRMHTSDSKWWCSGFYPGTLCYLYEATGDKSLLAESERILQVLSPEQFNTTTHDVGFMIGCSFGNAERLTGNKEYREAMLNGAKSLTTRFNAAVGCIKSHNRPEFSVIIDNMMNLELLFRVAQMTGEKSYYNLAVKHAETTMQNHFRKDGSVYHALIYDAADGKILQYQGGQGLHTNSSWSRGQAWAIYGFAMTYRFTQDKRFLEQAMRTADFYLNHPAMPEDLVPYWDFDAPHIPNAKRDASAAAITASGLLELAAYCPDKTKAAGYEKAARRMMASLSSPAYFAEKGTNGGFLILHCVGNMPANKEVDAPLSYADYYYAEALLRLKTLDRK